MTTALGKKIEARIQEMGTNPYALATKMGFKPDRYSKVIGGKSKNPKMESLKEIAQGLGWSVEELLSGTEHADLLKAPVAIPPPKRKGIAARPTEDRDLPLLGPARAGYAGKDPVFDSTTPAAHIERPPQLRGVVGAYSSPVVGDSMAPRLRHGDRIYLDPSQPPKPGDDVVVIDRNGLGFLKEFVEITEKKVRCVQLNPPAKVDFMLDQVEAVHRVSLHWRP